MGFHWTKCSLVLGKNPDSSSDLFRKSIVVAKEETTAAQTKPENEFNESTGKTASRFGSFTGNPDLGMNGMGNLFVSVSLLAAILEYNPE